MTSWKPTADARARQLRAQVLREIREFFFRRGVLEVETPILSRAANPDPAIASVECKVDRTTAWLRTSPEFALKRLLADAPVAVYEMGRVFRDGESGSLHNPEFTMLEWYRPGLDDLGLAREVVELVHTLQRCCGSGEDDVRWIPFEQALALAVPGLSLSSSLADFARCFEARGWPGELHDRREAFEIVMACALDPIMREVPITVLTDFPTEAAALAKSAMRTPETSSRFEVYFHGMELANGYHEVQSADELESRFVAESQRRAGQGLPALPLDRRLVAAQRAGFPDCAGVALGVDRLIMGLGGYTHLDQVINFPITQA